MISARYALSSDAADQKLIELVVKSLSRGPFRSKVNCDPGAAASAAVAVRRRAAGETVLFACLVSPASEMSPRKPTEAILWP
jgi:hypothetical protein